MAQRTTPAGGEPAPLDPTRLDLTADGAPIMWTVEETAAFLGLTRHTLDVWRSSKAGGPVYVKIAGNRVRYFPADVRDWLIAQRRGS
ncbi:helix-turn-helix transcriptional regulator [Microcella frigidaquae]|uniref:Putative DNA-binding transcriptional regulator AlpA n=1 Tax=Microcella frigidaquae TaxID=424758 RepID=A0A840XMM1_9MICO|nr:helix-turn-helix domain-containing protein [Microcella frigidaquae]MBB5618077.1 putative DNA-binding transcriptional regulator AlpA [Microcella frigidaquae]